MPIYVYTCRNDHELELFAQHSGARPPEVACPTCHSAMKPSIAATHRASRLQIINDVPEHYNKSFGRGVRSRRHLAQLQQKYGYRDVEGKQEPPTDWS